MFYVPLIVLIGIAFLLLVINLQMHVALKFGLAMAGMYCISKVLARKLNIKDEWGMLMVKSNAGLATVERLAKDAGLWNLFADIGTVLAYGAASFFIIKRKAAERAIMVFFGLVLLSIISFFVAPVVFPFLLGTLGEEGLAAKGGDGSYAVLGAALLYLGGLAFAVFASLLAYSAVIVSAIIGTLFFGTGQLAKTAPGATLILPGVNIPFAEGIIALALILVVHEGAHAVLARVGKVKILSSGVVLFGIIPIGAFVEPDDRQLKKLDNEKQTRVLAAGSAANLLTSLAMFAVFLAFLVSTEQYKETGLLVLGGNESGAVIYRINGQDAMAFLQSADNETKYSKTHVFETSAGTYEGTITKGTLYDLSSLFFIAKYPNPALQFLYNLLGLAFSLNFVIGVVNLLPLPFFDGYRLLEINFRSKEIMKAVSWLTVLAFIINFIPWLKF